MAVRSVSFCMIWGVGELARQDQAVTVTMFLRQYVAGSADLFVKVCGLSEDRESRLVGRLRVWANPFAALRTGLEFEAVGVKDTGAPPAGIGRWRSDGEDGSHCSRDVVAAPAQLNSGGSGRGNIKIDVVATRDLGRVCHVRATGGYLSVRAS